MLSSISLFRSLRPATVLQQLQGDWTYLTGTVGVTASPAYLKLEGKPVVSLWGLGLAGGGDHIVTQSWRLPSSNGSTM
jgi:hypothetical protein